MKRFTLFAAAVAALLTTLSASSARAQGASAAAGNQSGGGGIQWFTHLKDGLAEAKRTGRPILFLSAAPSCGGVPGVW